MTIVSSSVQERPPDLLELRDLHIYFDSVEHRKWIHRLRTKVRAVDGVALTIRVGETFGLAGETGCGKSTLGRGIVGLYPPTAGSVLFEGIDLASLRGDQARSVRRKLQMVFQDPYASLDPRMPIRATIGEPLRLHRIGTRRERRERVLELLEAVGLKAADADRYPHELSGGQRQRVAICRALALDPALVVADEPLSALDVSVQSQILNLLEGLQSQLGLSYLLISHDLAVVHHASDRVGIMYLGRIVEVASNEELTRAPLHPYTVALLSAVRVPDPSSESARERIVLQGDPPSPTSPPAGCRFHPRCWLRARLGNPIECELEDPILRPFEGEHVVACHFSEELDGSSEQRLAVAGLGGRSGLQRG